MTIESYPFDDQASYEVQWQSMMRYFRGTGVVPTGAAMTTTTTNCGVSTTGNPLEVAVSAGEAYIRGFYFTNDADYPVAITSNSGGGGDRVDLITLRLDRPSNQITPFYIEGSTTPTQNVDIWDLPLARVTVTTSDVLTVADRRMMQVPYALIPACRRVHTGTPSIATGGWSNMSFSGAATYQTMPGMINASQAGRIYPNPYGTSQGYYQVTGKFTYSGGTPSLASGVRVLLNGSTTVGEMLLPSGTAAGVTVTCSGIAFCTTSSDYIEVQGRNDTGSAQSGSNLSLSCIYLGSYSVS